MSFFKFNILKSIIHFFKTTFLHNYITPLFPVDCLLFFPETEFITSGFVSFALADSGNVPLVQHQFAGSGTSAIVENPLVIANFPPHTGFDVRAALLSRSGLVA